MMEENDALSMYDAEEDWNRARRKVLYQEVVCFFKQCSVDLLSFEDVRAGLHLSQKIDRGLQEIPLDRIRGSVGRYDDFTSAFMPRKKHLRERWERVDVAMKAGELLESLQANEKLMAAVGEWHAEKVVLRAFEKARMYEQAKMYAKAAEYYQDYLKKYPDSKYAAQAKESLAMLQQHLR